MVYRRADVVMIHGYVIYLIGHVLIHNLKLRAILIDYLYLLYVVVVSR